MIVQAYVSVVSD